MAEVEIGIGKSGRRAYGFDDIAIVPSRRTRDPEDVDITWDIDAFTLELPLMGAAMDGVTSPATCIEMGRLGGVGVLNLEGLWTRYEDPEPYFEEVAELSAEKATLRMQEIYLEPVKPELIGQRVAEVKSAGVVTAASLTPQRVREWAPLALDGGLDILVIQGTVVSAEHVSTREEPLNLKEYIADSPVPVIVGGCASYSTALHLMRTGAVGVLVEGEQGVVDLVPDLHRQGRCGAVRVEAVDVAVARPDEFVRERRAAGHHHGPGESGQPWPVPGKWLVSHVHSPVLSEPPARLFLLHDCAMLTPTHR